GAGEFLADGNTRIDEPLNHRRVEFVFGIGPLIDQYPDRHAGAESLGEFGDVAGVLHVPEGHVDLDLLIADQVQDRFATVFELRIAESLRRWGLNLCLGSKCGCGDETYSE